MAPGTFEVRDSVYENNSALGHAEANSQSPSSSRSSDITTVHPPTPTDVLQASPGQESVRKTSSKPPQETQKGRYEDSDMVCPPLTNETPTPAPCPPEASTAAQVRKGPPRGKRDKVLSWLKSKILRRFRKDRKICMKVYLRDVHRLNFVFCFRLFDQWLAFESDCDVGSIFIRQAPLYFLICSHVKRVGKRKTGY